MSVFVIAVVGVVMKYPSRSSDIKSLGMGSAPVPSSPWVMVDSTLAIQSDPMGQLILHATPVTDSLRTVLQKRYDYDAETARIMGSNAMMHETMRRGFRCLEAVIARDPVGVDSVLTAYRISYTYPDGRRVGWREVR